MNRNITLILSAVVVVILLAVWLYLMFFATPKGQDAVEGSGAYSEFGELGEDAPGGGGNNGTGAGEGDGNSDYNPETGAYEPDVLRQLTTRNVVGYREVEIASTTHVIYMESGVGHIYSINLENGVEERVSATTIPDAREARFSKDGSLVAVKTGKGSGIQPLSLAKVDFVSQSVVLEQFENAVSQFAFTEDDILLYSLVNNNSVTTMSYNPDDQSSDVVFSTPFREVVVDFGTSVDGPHYFWPKPSHLLEGFVYQVTAEGAFKRLPVDGFGLSAAVFEDEVVTSYRDNTRLVTALLNPSLSSPEMTDFALVPEKCVGDSSQLYCAVPKNRTLKYNDIDRWYQGAQVYSDSLWLVDGDISNELIDVASHSGRQVDVINGALGVLSNDWYFQNKQDGSLWVYELSHLEEGALDNPDNL